MPDMPKPPSSPSPRGPSREESGSPLPSSVTDALITPSRSRTAITALVDVRQRLLHDPVDRALELCVQAPAGVLELRRHVEPVDRLRAARERL
jgi:hypothetical protein